MLSPVFELDEDKKKLFSLKHSARILAIVGLLTLAHHR